MARSFESVTPLGHRHASTLGRATERLVIELVLVGTARRDGHHRAIDGVAAAEIRRDRNRIPSLRGRAPSRRARRNCASPTDP